MIEKNIDALKHRVAAVAGRCGKTLDNILLVAVTKTHPPAEIDLALRHGIRHIGENKIQDAALKLPLLTQSYEGFHFIGHLQSNKINALLKLNPYLIHSIDSYELAVKLDAALASSGKVQSILLQVNTTGEDSKSGIEPADLFAVAARIAELKYIRIMGLMTIGKQVAEPEEGRIYFTRLRVLFDQLKAAHLPNVQMQWLSMGMTDDFEIAIEEGANLIRIGSAIFGARNYGAQPV